MGRGVVAQTTPTGRSSASIIYAVEFSLTLRARILEEGTFFPECPAPICKFCGSDEVVRVGYKKNKHERVQRYRCKSCARKFSISEDGLGRWNTDPPKMENGMWNLMRTRHK